MRRELSLLGLLTAGCFAGPSFNAEGFQCAVDADCDTGTFCFQNVCRVKLDPNSKPGPYNTGVPQLAPGESLEITGALTVTDAGAVFDRKDIQGCVLLQAPNVTIRRSRIRCDGYWVVRLENNATGAVFEDVEVDGISFGEASGITGSDLTIRRANIHSVGNGVRAEGNVRIEASYIHDLVGPSASVGLYSDGAIGVTATGNTVEAPSGVGAAIGMDGTLSDIHIERNWLSGGENTVRVRGSSAFDFHVIDNRFGRTYSTAPFNLTVGVTTEGNVFDDDNSAVPR